MGRMSSPFLATPPARLLAVVAVSYLIGSIPTGYWLGKGWKGIDIRQHGSGNLGATNVFRVLGKGPGMATLAIDILKGALPVLWVQSRFPGALSLAVAAGLAAIVGHMGSIFVGFRGGKGVATSAGVFAALMPIPSAIAFSIFLGLLGLTRFVSVSSVAGAAALAISALLMHADPLLAGAAVAVAAAVLWKHRHNLRRVAAGTEPRVGRGEGLSHAP